LPCTTGGQVPILISQGLNKWDRSYPTAVQGKNRPHLRSKNKRNVKTEPSPFYIGSVMNTRFGGDLERLMEYNYKDMKTEMRTVYEDF
jgi:hypothetical protein